MSNQSTSPSPERFFGAVTAYQQSAIIKGAIELDLFTAIAEGAATAAALAASRQTSERGMRILCDYLVIIGFLTKAEGQYGLTPESSVFLDRRSPSYLGPTIEFLQSPLFLTAYEQIAEAVRKGGTTLDEEGSMSPENPVWLRFARTMTPIMVQPAQMIAQLMPVETDRHVRLLDLAAGHGIFGITFAQRYPNLEVVAVDWAPVLEIATENARKAGVSDRYRTLPGSAFEIEFGEGFDLVLLTNFLHHFSAETCEGLLKKIHAALNDRGRVGTLDFIPNEDRVTPPAAALFSMTMLASTAAGDAYTFNEYREMFRRAGYSRSEIHSLGPSPEQLIVSYKQ
ncbi:MAG TPA: class I SAM-dependent methyltransferase [Blastocatellia bacterium]|nr:class I SAM-dependent methyltransferase [Blastocatellia bacterium]